MASRNIEVRVTWVPSHGKKEEWKAPDGSPYTTALWRRLNDAADTQVGIASKAYFEANCARSVSDLSIGTLFAVAAMLRLSSGSQCYTRRVFGDNLFRVTDAARAVASSEPAAGDETGSS